MDPVFSLNVYQWCLYPLLAITWLSIMVWIDDDILSAEQQYYIAIFKQAVFACDSSGLTILKMGWNILFTFR